MADAETTFRAADLIGSAGVGANGEKLVNTLDLHYSPELDAALLKRTNEGLTDELNDQGWDGVAKIAGVEEVADARVRGGEANEDDAWVSYVFYDENGESWKGAFPYKDLGSSKSDDHISQRDSVAASPAARDHAAAQEKARKAAASSGSSDSGGDVDPIGQYEELKAPEVVAYLDAHPEREDVVKALETATRGESARSTVLDWEPKSDEDDDSEESETS